MVTVEAPDSAYVQNTVSTDTTFSVTERKPTLEITSEFIVFGTVPRASLWTENAGGWEYQVHNSPEASANSKFTGADALPDPPVDADKLCAALKECQARVEYHVNGSQLFKNMFRVPHRDVDGQITAYACFLDLSGNPISPHHNSKLLVAYDPDDSTKVISPPEKGAKPTDNAVVQLVPEVVMREGATTLASEVEVVDPDTDPSRTLVIIGLNNTAGSLGITLIYKARATPLDNSGKAFKVISVDGGQYLAPPDAHAHFTGDSLQSTGHLGKRVLQSVANYLLEGEHDIDKFANDEDAANTVVQRVAATLSQMIQNSHLVRDVIVQQAFARLGPGVFDPADSSMRVIFDRIAPGDFTLSMHMDHTFHVEVKSAQADSPSAQRNVIIKKIAIVLKIQ